MLVLDFVKIRPEGADFSRVDRQTDMTKLIVAFRNFANAPKISTFCPHGIWICPVFIFEKTAIIS